MQDNHIRNALDFHLKVSLCQWNYVAYSSGINVGIQSQDFEELFAI